VLSDGVSNWLVVQWDLDVFATTSQRTFQTWIGLNGKEDVTFAYDPAALPADPNGQPFAVGAENSRGTGGEALPGGQVPTQDLRVTGGKLTPGGSITYTVSAQGLQAGAGTVTTTMEAPDVPGTYVVRSGIQITSE
jgi:hypothetical protein